jgi:proteic killer suppression protein
VIGSFRDRGTQDVFNRVASKEARNACPQSLWGVARRKLDQLNAVVSLQSLAIPPGNRLEALVREREGQHSIRINDRFRICFVWSDNVAQQVEIVDYH